MYQDKKGFLHMGGMKRIYYEDTESLQKYLTEILISLETSRDLIDALRMSDLYRKAELLMVEESNIEDAENKLYELYVSSGLRDIIGELQNTHYALGTSVALQDKVDNLNLDNGLERIFEAVSLRDRLQYIYNELECDIENAKADKELAEWGEPWDGA